MCGLIQIWNAVQAGEVGKSAVELRGGLRFAEALRRKQVKQNRGFGGFRAQTGGGDLDHLLGGITGCNGYAIMGKKERVFTGAAVEFEDVFPALEDLSQLVPHGLALGSSDHGIRKDVVVFTGHLVEYTSGRRRCNSERGHASTAIMVECRPSRES